MDSMIQRLRKMPEANRQRLMRDCIDIFDGGKPSPIYREIELCRPNKRSQWKRAVISLFRRADMRLVGGGKKDGPQDSLKGEFNL
jgi:hypothetical protein